MSQCREVAWVARISSISGYVLVTVFVITIVRYSLGRQNLPMVGGRDACQGDSGGPVIRSSISSFSSLLSSVMGRFLEFMLELEANCSHPMFFDKSFPSLLRSILKIHFFRSQLCPHLTQNWVPILNKIGSPWHLGAVPSTSEALRYNIAVISHPPGVWGSSKQGCSGGPAIVLCIVLVICHKARFLLMSMTLSRASPCGVQLLFFKFHSIDLYKILVWYTGGWGVLCDVVMIDFFSCFYDPYLLHIF